MKKYSLNDFNSFEHSNGYIICPSGDYSSIKKFPEKCSFGAGCSFGERCSFGAVCIFGERCSFGEWCSYENTRVKNGKYFACDRIGSEKRKTYFFIDENGKMFVRSGCFFGTLTEFIARVKEVHVGTKFEKEYLVACELAKIVLLEK